MTMRIGRLSVALFAFVAVLELAATAFVVWVIVKLMIHFGVV